MRRIKKNTTDSKKKFNPTPKFMFGGNTGTNDFLGELLTKRQNQANANPTRIENPSTALADNNIALAKAQSEAQNNPWTQGLDMFGNLAMQVGSSMMQQGMANGEGIAANSDGEAGKGFNWGNLLSGVTQGLGAFGNYQTNSFAMGGMTGGNSQMIEAEGGEVIETPDGAMQELQGPDHEQGGIDLNLPEGTEIFSKRLKGPDGRTMADRKISREKKLTKAEKLYKKNPSDITLKKTVERIAEANEREESLDMAEMEQARQAYNMGAMMLTGGKMRYATGGVTDTVPVPGATKDFRTSLEQLQDHYSVYMNQYPESNIDFTTEQGRKNFQNDFGLTPDGIFGRGTQRMVDQHLSEGVNANMTDLYISLGDPTSMKPLDIPTGESLEDYQTGKMAKTKAYEDGTLDSSYLTRDANLNGEVDFSESRVGGAVNSAVDYISSLFNKRTEDGTEQDENNKNNKNNKGINFTFGDGLGLVGNYMAMTDPMKNTLANRAGDRANINYFEDYGKEGLETLEGSKRFAMDQRDQAMQDLELSKTAARNRSRGMSRGLNSMRAGDLATELGAMQAEGKINSSYMAQLLGIDGKIASAQDARDVQRMTGESTKDMNDRRDYDGFYEQLGIDKAIRAKGMINMGSIANKIKERGVKGNALNQLYENYKIDGMSGDVAYKAAQMAIQDPTFFNSLEDNPNKNTIFEGLQDGTMTKDDNGKLYNAEGQELDLQTLKPIV